MKEWTFEFPYYVSTHSMIDHYGNVIISTRKYFFITFWFIVLIHGKNKMYELSSKSYLESMQ